MQSTANDVFFGTGPTMQFFHGTPAAGRWTVVLLTFAPVDGAHLSEPFTGAVSFTAPAVTSSGIPNSASTVLPPASRSPRRSPSPTPATSARITSLMRG